MIKSPTLRKPLPLERPFDGITEELPTYYDLVVNTDVLSLAEAAQIVVDIAKA